jgi:hypothetical protein
MTPELGRLERVELRNIWANEAMHFTPWLAQENNLALLGEAIGIDLELEATEKSVGPFSADILCKDTANENWVLIENQLERTDHKHLGQLITYASGLKAVTIVWIANPFTEEHRSALDWLNEITDSRFNFFGLEVELWKIGDSNVAPKFNVISKPNDWSKTVSEGVARVENEGLTDTKQLQLEFWTYFHEYAKSNAKGFKPTKPHPQHWMNMSIGRSGFRLTAIASLWNSETQSYSPNELRAQIEIHDNNNAKLYFEKLREQAQQIEFELGFPVTWFNDPEKISCKIVTSNSVNLNDRPDWNNQCKWLVKRLDDLHRVFWHRIRDL